MNELVKSQSSILPVNYKKQTSKRCWELSYSPTDKFYLTQEEKNAFLNEIGNGKDFVVLNSNIFSKFFKTLVFTKGNTSDELLKQIGL